MKQVWMKGLMGWIAIMNVMCATAQDSTATPKKDTIEVCYNKTTVLIFPEAIEGADYGSDDILIKPAAKGRILKVKAARNDFKPTNLTVFTEGGKVYVVSVCYREFPVQLVYNYSGQPASAVTDNDGRMTMPEIRECAGLIAEATPRTKRPRIKDYKMRVQLQGAFIKDNVLFFLFEVQNKSNIPYDISYARFFEQDRVQTKRSTNMEKELQPVYLYNSTENCIPAKGESKIVVAFDKFTIANHKYFTVQLFEKNGDRELNMHIRGSHILEAAPF
jgi:conjugative transposon TraN protein